jgi:hypothetical protein
LPSSSRIQTGMGSSTALVPVGHRCSLTPGSTTRQDAHLTGVTLVVDGLAYLADHGGESSWSASRPVNAGRSTDRPEAWCGLPSCDRAYHVYFGGQDGHVYGYEPGARLFDVELDGPVDS